MDHIVYLDTKANELENLLAGKKTMIIRGAAGRKLPHGRVHPDDILYFVLNNGEGKVRARAVVKRAYHSEKLSSEESKRLVEVNQERLMLNENLIQRFSGKRYLVLVEVALVEALEPFEFDRSAYGNMDDWLPVGEIKKLRV